MNHSNWNSCIDYERNEIVFENRNKLFGAYIIRRDYSRNVLWSFIVACMLMGTVLAPFFIKDLQNQSGGASEKFSEEIILQTYNPPPVEIKQPVVSPPELPSKVPNELINPVVVDQSIATADVQMSSGNTSTSTEPSNGGEIISTMGSSIAIPVIPDIIPDNTPLKWAPVMPKFKGGDEELLKYLSSHIRFPSRALAENIEGTVYVSFVVDTTGLVTNVKLIHGIFKECDLEAVKGVSNMPRWIPGSQNGHKVSVEMSLPVRFIIK